VSILLANAAAIIRDASSQVKNMARPVVKHARIASGKAKKTPSMTMQMRFQIRPARRVRTAIGILVGRLGWSG
jgi:hypothetical protein